MQMGIARYVYPMNVCFSPERPLSGRSARGQSRPFDHRV
jgi:hypothetical protein